MQRNPLLCQIRESLLNICDDKSYALGLAKRFEEKGFFRSTNKASHICIYSCVFDAESRRVWLGLHKKSGLWLPPGEHLEAMDRSLRSASIRCLAEELGVYERDELVMNVEYITKTPIHNPNIECREHFDLWFFIPLPVDTKLAICSEFRRSCWFDLEEVIKPERKIIREPSVFKGLAFLLSKLKN